MKRQHIMPQKAIHGTINFYCAGKGNEQAREAEKKQILRIHIGTSATKSIVKPTLAAKADDLQYTQQICKGRKKLFATQHTTSTCLLYL
jgi:hypothetical protein